MFGLDVVDHERRERNAVVDEGVLDWLHRRVGVGFK